MNIEAIIQSRGASDDLKLEAWKAYFRYYCKKAYEEKCKGNDKQFHSFMKRAFKVEKKINDFEKLSLSSLVQVVEEMKKITIFHDKKTRLK